MPAPTVAIPAEIIGRTRQAIAAINAEHTAFIGAVRRLPQKHVVDLARVGNLNRARAHARVRDLLPGEPYIIQKRTLIYRTARHVQQPLSDGLKHDGLEVCWTCVGQSRGEPMRLDRPASLFLGFHSLARLLQRAWPAADIRSAVFEAHDALLAAPEDALPIMEAQRAWMIPIKAGAFPCDVRIVREHRGILGMPCDSFVYVRCATFLANDQLGANQRAQVAAMRFTGSGRSLGDGLCMPPQLRNVIDRASI